MNDYDRATYYLAQWYDDVFTLLVANMQADQMLFFRGDDKENEERSPEEKIDALIHDMPEMQLVLSVFLFCCINF